MILLLLFINIHILSNCCYYYYYYYSYYIWAVRVFDIRYYIKIRSLQLLRALKFNSRPIRITAFSSQSFDTFSHKFSAYISRREANYEITDPYREDWSECAATTRGFSGPRNPTIDLVSSRMKQKAKWHRAR